MYSDGTNASPYGNIDPPKVLLTQFGDVIVMTHGTCGTDPPGDESDPVALPQPASASPTTRTADQIARCFIVVTL